MASPTFPATPAGPSPIPFQNTYARLPSHFYARVAPTPVAAPRLLQLNAPLAEALGLDPAFLATPQGTAILAGNQVAHGSEPLAIAYAGHQFGGWVPQLGDGRANLLGEVIARDGLHYDLQLKGSGPTPFSRRGDGRAALGPVLREYLVSESMAALGIPTTRALAAVSTGQPVFRETPQPGAILTRVARSHLRVGTFQFFAGLGDTAAVRQLADYSIARHYPEATTATNPYRAFLDGVILRQADLVAQWMLVGFVHGVMNTDNTSISGETIDYGPCAFLEAYDPATVFSSIDHRGRYSFSNQPHAAHWNLTRLAETLLPLLGPIIGDDSESNQEAALDSAREALGAFGPRFEQTYHAGLLRKIGLPSTATPANPADVALAQDLLDRMAASHADYTLTFHRLADAATNPAADHSISTLFSDPTVFTTWATLWRSRLQSDGLTGSDRAAAMRQANPAIIPRNHLVEAVIRAAVDRDDLQPFRDLLEATTHPFDDRAELSHYTAPARPEQCIRETFCGT